ncbi:unnamed protein product [Scytosiphon promiscuus]
MEFDSLAFSATRLAPQRETRVFCPACQEVCVPEPSVNNGSNHGALVSPPPTCPVCSEECASRISAATSESRGASPSDPSPAATAVPGDANPDAAATATPPPPASGSVPETPPAARRARVSERVAREVLNFMAAIERGESLTVGLPLPPGAVRAGRVLRARPWSSVGRAPAPKRSKTVFVGMSEVVEENSWVLHQTVLRLTGGPPGSDLTIDAVFAPFSPPPAASVFGPVVLAMPPTADRDLDNEADVKGSVLMMDRGVCTFASKALRANAAGASAAVIVQTHDVWPYVMEDSKGEAKAGGGLDIPVCMVSKEKGEAIKKAVQSAGEGATIRAELSVSSSEKDCIVCQELFAVGVTLVRLPCGHLYHEACLLKWLKLSNTCPYCRRELPSSNDTVERARRSRQGAGGVGGGEEAWRGFFD